MVEFLGTYHEVPFEEDEDYLAYEGEAQLGPSWQPTKSVNIESISRENSRSSKLSSALGRNQSLSQENMEATTKKTISPSDSQEREELSTMEEKPCEEGEDEVLSLTPVVARRRKPQGLGFGIRNSEALRHESSRSKDGTAADGKTDETGVRKGTESDMQFPPLWDESEKQFLQMGAESDFDPVNVASMSLFAEQPSMVSIILKTPKNGEGWAQGRHWEDNTTTLDQSAPISKPLPEIYKMSSLVPGEPATPRARPSARSKIAQPVSQTDENSEEVPKSRRLWGGFQRSKGRSRGNLEAPNTPVSPVTPSPRSAGHRTRSGEAPVRKGVFGGLFGGQGFSRPTRNTVPVIDRDERKVSLRFT